MAFNDDDLRIFAYVLANGDLHRIFKTDLINQAYVDMTVWLQNNKSGLVYERLHTFSTSKELWYFNFWDEQTTTVQAAKILKEDLPEIVRVQLLLGAV